MATEAPILDVPAIRPVVAPSAKPVCRHCGAGLIDERMRSSGFCCAGCSYVFRLVHEHGFSSYYKIKDEVTAPADAAVFQARDYAWLEEAQREVEAALDDQAGAGELERPEQVSQRKPAAKTGPELTLDVQGISCAGCVWLIEKIFLQQPGARDIFVNAQYGTMRLRWLRGPFSAVEFARKLQAFGYLAGPAGETVAEPESRGLAKRIGLCAALAMNVMLFSLPTYFGMERDFEWAGLFGLLSLIFGTLSVLVGGTYFLSRAVRALRERALHIDLPIAVGIVGAYSGSLYGWMAGQERFVYFDFVSAFTLLMLIGRWAQVAAVERNRRQLLSQQPKPPQVGLSDGRRIAPEKVVVGQQILLLAGQTLPVDSRLDSAEATFSLASINGEAEPRQYGAHQRVPAGAINLGRNELKLTTLQDWNDSLLAQLLQAGDRLPERAVFLERIVRGYLIGIFGVAIAAGVGWWWATSDAMKTWAVVTAVLVVSCPCAVALAFPLADEMATVALRRRGVFVRETDLWNRLSRVRKLVFDKTGTLTLETPVLENPEVLTTMNAEARGQLLALVRDNPHPISQSLLENLLATGGTSAVCEGAEIRETIGFGIEAGNWSLGRPGWRAGCDDDTENEGSAVFAYSGQELARFRFRDTVRSDAKTEIARLRRRGLPTYILSGDRKDKVTAMAKELGVEAQCAWGEMTPRGKALWVSTHGADDVLMLGDGANDSLAFDRALCRGTPVIHRGVLERKADFYYLGRGIGGLRALFEVNAIRRRTQRGILVFSVVYNLLAVGLAVAGRMNPLVAAALMPINSLITLAWVTGGMRAAFRQ
jgi:Cu2+-exporting ATPase